ncbi:MAG: dipeptidase PepV [Clostridia bacterium]|nr:dipeptidase PepV [Clostridia bacterium]
MNAKVDAIIAAKQDLIISDLQDQIRIPSVKEEPTGKKDPFGPGVRASLDAALALGEKYGFEVRDIDGYAGTIEYGPKDAEVLGVVAHLDVVPAGEGWDYDPFGAEIVGDRIYGRGTTDDKGPFIAVLHALSAIKEAGIPLKRRVRVILGCDEESGWGCMEYYKKHEPAPDLGFTPDGEYPVVNSEKGLLQVYYKSAFESKIRLYAGDRANVVPGSATAYLPLTLNDVMPAAEAYSLKSGFPVSASADDEGTVLTVTGQSTHASIPHLGLNALQAMLQLLAMLPLEENDAKMAEGLAELFKMDHHGESMGLDVTDESGRQTLNPAAIVWEEDGIHKLALDLRCPASRPLDVIKAELLAHLAPLGFELYDSHEQKALFVPADSELVSKLINVYAERTGVVAKPLAIGGGTYARAFENTVAFGCKIPNHDAPMHMPNEYIPIEDQMFNTYMMADAILALAAE